MLFFGRRPRQVVHCQVFDPIHISFLGSAAIVQPANLLTKEGHMESNLIAAITSAVGATLSGVAAAIGIAVAYKVHNSQKLLAQRQLLLPLWDHMSNLSKIDSKNPIAPDVIKVINTLELVALCCEGGMIDEDVIRRTFKDQFMMHYEDIKKCSSIPGTQYDGEALLKQNRAATEFYISLDKERLAQDRISKA